MKPTETAQAKFFTNNTAKEYMFSQPRYGWSVFNYFKYSDKDISFPNGNYNNEAHVLSDMFRVSYLIDVPNDIFKAIIDSIQSELRGVVYTNKVYFDAEGWDWYLTFCWGKVFIEIPYCDVVEGNPESDYNIIIPLNTTVVDFAHDWIKTVDKYIVEWSRWFDWSDGECDEAQYPQNNYNLLKEESNNLSNLLERLYKEKNNGN